MTVVAHATLFCSELKSIDKPFVSNSLSGGDRELDEVSAMGDPAHVAQIGNGVRVSTDESRRRVSLQ